MKPTYALVAGIALLATSGQRAAGQTPPPVRQLGPRLAMSNDSLGSILGLRPLGDGRLLVNDMLKRRLIIFDSTLTRWVVVLDSTSGGTNKGYGSNRAGVIRFAGDSTLFVDGASLALVVIDPTGKTVRTIAAPVPGHIGLLADPMGGAALDARGRLVYRLPGTSGSVAVAALQGTPPIAAADPRVAASGLPSFARDSAAIIRGDMTTRLVDTLAYIAVPRVQTITMITTADGNHVPQIVVDPVQLADDWAVTTDGSVAIVRGHDYHIDWINADGTRTSTARIGHDWHRLLDSDKAAIIDSVHLSQDSVRSRNAGADSVAVAAGKKPNPHAILGVVDASELPDYMPPFTAGAVKADADNNLWIRQVPVKPTDPAIYDIVNRTGVVVDRVQLPLSLSLAGFGPGVVYLTSREGSGMVVLRYRIR